MSELESNRSSLWNLTAVGAAAGGIGYGMRGRWGELRHAMRVGELVSPIERSAAGMSRIATSTPIEQDLIKAFAGYDFRAAPGTSNNILGLLSSISDKNLARNELADLSYRSIISGGRAGTQEAMDVYRQVKSASSMKEALDIAQSQIQQRGGSANVFRSVLEKEILPGGTYPEGRAETLSNLVVSKGYGEKRLGIDFSKLTPEERKFATSIRKRFGEVGGDKITGYEFFRIKGTPMMRATIAGEQIGIPLAETGTTYIGGELTTALKTGHIWDPAKEGLIPFHEHHINVIEENLLKSKSLSETKQGIIDINNSLIRSRWDDDAAARAAAIYTPPTDIAHRGARIEASLAKLRAVYGGSMAEGELQKALTQIDIAAQTGTGQLFPVGSPLPVSKGTLTIGDPRVGLYGGMGRFFPIERRPLQGLRTELGPTARSRYLAEQMGYRGALGHFWSRVERTTQGSMYEDLLKGKETPKLLGLYVRPGSGLEKQLAEGEALIHTRAAGLLESERLIPKEIYAPSGFQSIHEDIQTALEGKKIGDRVTFAKPLEGAVGKDIRGKIIATEGRFGEKVIAAEKIGGDRIKLHVKQTFGLQQGDLVKAFGPAEKHVAEITGERGMIEATAGMEVGARGRIRHIVRHGVGGQHVEALLDASRLASSKNLYANLTQQVEALGIFAAARLNQGSKVARRAEIERYLMNPTEFLKTDYLMARHAADADLQIQKSMLGFAKKLEFTPQELGMTFGMLPEERAIELSKEFPELLPAWKKYPFVIGEFKGALGDVELMLSKTGKARLDLMGYNVLAAKTYGDIGNVGADVAAELAARTEGKGSLSSATTMLESLLGQEPIGIKAKALYEGVPNIADIPAEKLIQEEGRYLGVGAGGPARVYVPGRAEAAELYQTTLSTTTGKVIPSDIEKGLGKLQTQVLAARAGREANIAGATEELSKTAYRAMAQQGTGGRAGGGGEILGSRRLVGRTVPAAAGAARESVYVNPGTLRSMMIEAGMSPDDIKLALKGGEPMMGVAWRHPATGPESAQFVKILARKNIRKDLVNIPELKGVLGDTTIDASQFVGYHGDVDADRYNISLITNRNTADRVRRGLEGEIRTNYNQYLHDHFAMEGLIGEQQKAKRNISDLAAAQDIALGRKKLTDVQVATGKVNRALARLRLGVAAGAPEEFQSLSRVMFHLEEQAISSKQEAMVGTFFSNLSASVKDNDKVKLAGVVEELMGPEANISKRLIIGGEEITGLQPYRHSPMRIAEKLLGAYHSPIKGDIDAAVEMANVAKRGAAKVSTEQMMENFMRIRGAPIDPNRAAFDVLAKGAPSTASKGTRGIRQAGISLARTKGILAKAKGPALIGAAAAAGVLMMAPSVSGTVPSSAEGPSGGRNLAASPIMPEGPPMESPPPRIMASKKAYEGLSSPMSATANIRTHMADTDNRYEDIMRQVNGMKGSGYATIRTVDDRSVLDPDILANKIYERL